MNSEPFVLEDFVVESNRIEGIAGYNWADYDAHTRLLTRESLSVSELVAFVNGVQPNAVLREKPGVNVVVGRHRPPEGGSRIVLELEEILYAAASTSANDIHRRYETLHPFTDGNGRSGRALWLYMMGGIERVPLGFLRTWYLSTPTTENESSDRIDEDDPLAFYLLRGHYYQSLQASR